MDTKLPTSIATLKKRVQITIALISKDTLQKVVWNTEFLLRLLLRQNGAHFKIIIK